MAAPLKAKGAAGADVAAVDPLKWLVAAVIDALTETLFHGVDTLAPLIADMLVKLPVITPVPKFVENAASPNSAALAIPPDDGYVVTRPVTFDAPE